MQKIIYIALIILLTTNIQAQQEKPVTITYDKSPSGDTLWITVNRPLGEKPGSLMFVASCNTDRDTFFFPVINTEMTFELLIPTDKQSGNLHLQSFWAPAIFHVVGNLLTRKQEPFTALLITDHQKLYNKEVAVSDDKQFILPGLVFEDRASLLFNYSAKNKKGHPDVSIKQVPEISAFNDKVFDETIPLAINNTGSQKKNIASKSGDDVVIQNDPRVKVLKSVDLVGKKKSLAEKYNDENVTGRFNDINERIIDCLDNDDILSFPDAISFILAKLPGLSSHMDANGEVAITWRNTITKAYFIDEIPVEVDQVQSLPVTDIALVKAFPPPFSGRDGSGGAIAIYTRKGVYARPNTITNKWLFQVKGYSPAIHPLFGG